MMTIVSAFLLAGCVHEGDMVPLNDAATKLGIPRAEATAYGTGGGPIIVTMPDGEVLTGRYHVIIGGSLSAGFAAARGSRATVLVSGLSSNTALENPFVAQASGSRGTTITCEGMAGIGGASGQCMTGNGAAYQIIF
jgi:hypothetical protein